MPPPFPGLNPIAIPSQKENGADSLANFVTSGDGARGFFNNLNAAAQTVETFKGVFGGGNTPAPAPAPAPSPTPSASGGGGGFNLMDLLPKGVRDKVYSDAENDYIASLSRRFVPENKYIAYAGTGLAIAGAFLLAKRARLI